jgi:predicted AAA+ superfamily ATPase
LRQDLLSLEPIRDFEGLETLLHLLRERVGSTLSYASLARDLHRDATTLKRWVGILERLYLIFIIRPFSKNVARAIVKEPKVYFFDSAMVLGSDAQKLENLCAFSLYKLCHFLEDSQGKSTALHFLRIKGGTEVDFLLQIEGRKPTLIEVKWSESNWSDQFRPFERTFPGANLIQVSHELNRAEVEFVGANSNRKIVRAKEWLQGLK